MRRSWNPFENRKPPRGSCSLAPSRENDSKRALFSRICTSQHRGVPAMGSHRSEGRGVRRTRAVAKRNHMARPLLLETRRSAEPALAFLPPRPSLAACGAASRAISPQARSRWHRVQPARHHSRGDNRHRPGRAKQAPTRCRPWLAPRPLSWRAQTRARVALLAVGAATYAPRHEARATPACLEQRCPNSAWRAAGPRRCAAQPP